MTTDLAVTIERLKEDIVAAADNSDRAADEIGVLLVTKGVEPERILEAYELGVPEFGENKVQELLRKKAALPDDIGWHMVGHLQTNKVKQVIGEVRLIHSLDSQELADEIEKQAAAKGLESVDCLLQVNVSGEESKFGFTPKGAEDFLAQYDPASVLQIRGLMTIGPHTDDGQKIRECFRELAEMKERLSLKFLDIEFQVLSMGMSADYQIAVEEGANLIRIGSKVFGPRPE